VRVRRARRKQHQGKLAPTRVVFIHETWAKTNTTRTHGRCASGARLVAKVPLGHWRTPTFLAAPRCDRIDAPCVIDGPNNGETFLAHVEQVLVPTLKPGDIVIMTTSAATKARRCAMPSGRLAPSSSSCRTTVLTSIQSSRSLPSSKTLLRKAAERTVEAT
jgi:hypothetical protein